MKNPSSLPRIVPLETPFQMVRKAFARIYRDRCFVRSVNATSVIRRISVPSLRQVSGNYLISGDTGIHAIQDGVLLRLFGTRSYGIAVRGNELFAASSNDHYSSIHKALIPKEFSDGDTLRFSEIFRIGTNKKGRVHQIAFFNDQLAVTHTYANTILFLDPESGSVISECKPFRDHFGWPIEGDHNHINSLSQCGECLLFSAYRAGTRSLIGAIYGDDVKGYAVDHVGIHDVYVTGKMIYYSDTFGDPVSTGGDDCGFLMANNRRVAEDCFSRPPGRAIRGIANVGNELLVGHSHKGARSKRYEGNGGLFRIIDGKVADEIVLPFAQVYDLMRTDGRHFEEPPHFEKWEELNEFLSSTLGPCVYEQRII
jgi:hypothetical protein